MSEEDAELVEGAKRGDSAAFEKIDQKYRRKICVFLSRRTGCFSLAEDIAQRALIKAFRSISSLKDGRKLRAWIYQIAFRIAVDDARQKKNVFLGEHFEHADPEKNPREKLIEAEERENLWSFAQKHLTADEFTAIWLKYAEEQKVEAIASTMSRTPGSVRVLLFRAREKLLKRIPPESP